MDITQFGTIAGASAVIIVVVEAFKRALDWDDRATARFAPLLSIVLGIIIVTAALAVVGVAGQPVDQLILTGILTGILAGASASGLYSLAGRTIIDRVAGDATTDTAGP